MVLALFAANLAVAGDPGLEIEYPNLPSVQTPNTVRTILPVYVEYIIHLAMALSGLIILGSLLYAGFLYMTSSGNPSALKNSKDRMLSSFLGIIILLSSYLIFQTINPKLIELTITGPEYIGGVIFRDPDAPEGSQEFATTGSVADFGKLNMQPETVTFISTDVEVVPCKEPGPNFSDRSNCEDHPYATITSDGTFPADAKAAKLIWKTPGVYLYDKTNFQGEMRIYAGNEDTLDDFAGKAKSIFFQPPNSTESFGAVLFTKEGLTGECKVLTDPVANLGSFSTSSLIVFRHRNNFLPTGAGVNFYANPNYQTHAKGAVTGQIGAWGNFGTYDNDIYSLSIDGRYLVVIADETGGTGKCEAFRTSDSDLSDNPIGQCTLIGTCSPGCPNIWGWCPVCTGSCASGFKVIPLTAASAATLPPPPPPPLPWCTCSIDPTLGCMGVVDQQSPDCNNPTCDMDTCTCTCQ